MPNYKRAYRQGGTWFFTVNLLERHDNRLLIDHIDVLRASVRHIQLKHPFKINAWVVLPEHMHCVLTLPLDDTDFSLRWRLIKSHFSKQMPKTEYRSLVRQKAGERGIWQRHYWEHMIRDDLDYSRHIEYTYWNPVKHGYVARVRDWAYSSFHRDVRLSLFANDWGDCQHYDLYDD